MKFVDFVTAPMHWCGCGSQKFKERRRSSASGNAEMDEFEQLNRKLAAADKQGNRNLYTKSSQYNFEADEAPVTSNLFADTIAEIEAAESGKSSRYAF